jgi:hypothetical protein
MNRSFLAISLALSTTTLAALAGPLTYPTQAFDASYVTKNPSGPEVKIRMVSDGKGHMRTETESFGQKTISIIDYLNKMCTTIMESQHMFIKVPLKESGPEITDEASAKKAGAKSLGQKEIDGHPCHGYESVQPSGKSQVWIGDDIRYLVRSDTTTPNGHVIMDLKAFSAGAPSGDLFTAPSGYKEMKMPIGMNK